jgi:hypothetical protein
MPSNIQDGAKHFLSAFSDLKAVARYSKEPRRSVPGFESLHRLAVSYWQSAYRARQRYSSLARVDRPRRTAETTGPLKRPAL